MGFIMLGILVAIRNFTIAVLLAWMGFSVAPDKEKENERTQVPVKSSASALFLGY